MKRKVNTQYAMTKIFKAVIYERDTRIYVTQYRRELGNTQLTRNKPKQG